jgi:hypothetical protein
MEQLHACAGLPRAGSTVLMNLLQQNPKVFTTSTDHLPFIIKQKILVRSRYNEQAQAMSHEQAEKAYTGLITQGAKGWYEALTDKEVVISKNRSWASIHHLFPKTKIVVMLRDLRDIVESFDRLNKKYNTLCSIDISDGDTLYNSMSDEQKYNFFFHHDNSLNQALGEVKKFMGLYNTYPEKILFIRYEDLLTNPMKTLEDIYSFYGVQGFFHNLSNIKQSEMFEHDHAYFSEITCHKTEPVFKSWEDPVRALDPRLHESIINNNKWYYETFYKDVL